MENTTPQATGTGKSAALTGSEIRALNTEGWTREQFTSHSAYLYSRKHTGRYSDGHHSVYFACSDSPTHRLCAGGFAE